MEILKKEKAAVWLVMNGISIDESGNPQPSFSGFNTKRVVPSEARSFLLLAQELVEWFEHTVAMLWLTVWTGYSPLEMQYFLKLREKHSHRLEIKEAPAQLFDLRTEEDRAILEEFVLSILAFNWEGYLISDNGNSIIWLADEVIDISTKLKEKDNELNERLEGLSIIPYERMVIP